ncbi:MAG TPA: hypothetical protein VIK91_18280 [Nannocystis sp.]
MSPNTPLSRSRPLLLGGLLMIAGCIEPCSDAGGPWEAGPGELGKGVFHYHCISDDDPACHPGDETANFPARIAVGGRFELSFTWNESSQVQPGLRSAAPDRLRVSGDTFTALAEGYTAVLAVYLNDDIADLIHIHASAPTRVGVQVNRVDYVDYVLAPGAEVRVQAITRDDDDYILAGLLNFEFTVDDPAVAEIVGVSPGFATLRGIGPGSTVLHARLGELVADVKLTVTGDPGPGSTTGDTGDTTTSSTTGDTGDATTGDTDDTDTDSTGSSSTGGAP